MKFGRLVKQAYDNWYQSRLDALNAKQLNAYIANGCKPWSEGYNLFKVKYIENALRDQDLLNKFREGLPLPIGYGKFLDERVVEYPWLLSRLDSFEGNLLDAGSSLNFDWIINHSIFNTYKIFLLTLAPEENCFCRKSISYIFGDLRNLPFRDNFFDLVVSISTLEHIGMDNMMYTANTQYKEDSRNDYIQAIKEIKRVLKSGQKCLITVPFGQYQYDGFQQQFDAYMVDMLKDVFNPFSLSEYYYKYSNDQWNISNREDCNNCEYFNIHKTKYFDKNSVRDYDDDLAAAARSIVALEMVK